METMLTFTLVVRESVRYGGLRRNFGGEREGDVYEIESGSWPPKELGREVRKGELLWKYEYVRCARV